MHIAIRKADISQRITVSVSEAMAALGISKSSMYELLNSNSIRSIHLGKKRLIILASIHEWIEGMEAASVSH